MTTKNAPRTPQFRPLVPELWWACKALAVRRRPVAQPATAVAPPAPERAAREVGARVRASERQELDGATDIDGGGRVAVRVVVRDASGGSG